jgi:hypothetical protein
MRPILTALNKEPHESPEPRADRLQLSFTFYSSWITLSSLPIVNPKYRKINSTLCGLRISQNRSFKVKSWMLPCPTHPSTNIVEFGSEEDFQARGMQRESKGLQTSGIATTSILAL